MTRRNFEVALKRGAVGEQIVRRILEARGWVCYQPTTEGAHCFDMLSIKDKKSAIALDVKAKARLNKWPATGVNLGHFNEYRMFSEKHSMPFWIVFVDESLMKIYGETLEALEAERIVEGVMYPFNLKTGGGIVRVWPLEAMKHIADLSVDQSTSLSAFSQRNHDFMPLPAHSDFIDDYERTERECAFIGGRS